MPIIEVSVGELLDKFSILEIKLEKLSLQSQKRNVQAEIESHQQVVNKYLFSEPVNLAYNELKDVNGLIWNGMERVFEIGDTPTKEYDPLTREITRLNMKRSFLKKEIDTLSNSKLTEEKSYFKK